MQKCTNCSCKTHFSLGAVCPSFTSATPCPWVVPCLRWQRGVPAPCSTCKSYPWAAEWYSQGRRWILPLRCGSRLHRTFFAETYAYICLYPFSTLLFLWQIIHFLQCGFLSVWGGQTGDCVESPSSDALLLPLSRSQHSDPSCLQQPPSHFQLSWLNNQNETLPCLWRRLELWYQCCRHIPLKPCTTLPRGRALLSETAFSTETLLSGKRNDGAEGNPERLAAPDLWREDKVQKHSFIFSCIFIFAGEDPFSCQLFSTCTQLWLCLARLGSLPSTPVCSTCSQAVAQTAALSCSCKRCRFMFYQWKSRQHSQALRFVQTEIVWQAKAALRGSDTSPWKHWDKASQMQHFALRNWRPEIPSSQLKYWH